MIWQSDDPETRWRNVSMTSYSGHKGMKDLTFFLSSLGRQERERFFFLFPPHDRDFSDYWTKMVQLWHGGAKTYAQAFLTL
jgi:hypothetical protein